MANKHFKRVYDKISKKRTAVMQDIASLQKKRFFNINIGANPAHENYPSKQNVLQRSTKGSKR